MKKKSIIISSLIMTIFLIILSINYLNEENYYIEEGTNLTDNSTLATVFVKNDEGDYIEYTDETYLPQDGYVLNTDDSFCLAGGEITYDYFTYEVKTTLKGADQCFLYYDKAQTLARIVLTDNGGIYSLEELGSESFAKIAVTQKYYDSLSDKSDFIVQNGMYKTEDNYGNSYYFRGGDLDNYVEFAGLIWRIVRIDGEGNVKLVINDTTASDITASLVSTKYSSSTSTLENAGYMYTTDTQDGYTESSVIKTTIDTWYKSYLIDYAQYLADATYCIDMTWYSYAESSGFTLLSSATGTTSAYSGAYARFYSDIESPPTPSTTPTPTLKCNDEDAFTVTATEDVSNGALTYPIALLTADEATFAGLVSGLSLVNGTSTYTGDDLYQDFNYLFKYNNPYYLISAYTAGRVYSVWNAGYLTSMGATQTHDAFVSISLSLDVLWTSGDGSSSNPYQVALSE